MSERINHVAHETGADCPGCEHPSHAADARIRAEDAADALALALTRWTGCKPGKTHNFITQTVSNGVDIETVESIRCQHCYVHSPDSPGYTGDPLNSCPRCHNPNIVELERQDETRSLVYRCRTCSHIFGEKYNVPKSALCPHPQPYSIIHGGRMFRCTECLSVSFGAGEWLTPMLAKFQ